MNDSTPDIIKKQMEIFLSKSESERFRIGNELNSFGRKVLESSLRNDHPGLSKIDLKIAVFKRCYAQFYSPEEFDRILFFMREFLLKENRITL
jgi:hypothetical protein